MTRCRATIIKNIKRNISKAVKKGCLVKKDTPLDEIIRICKKRVPPVYTRGAGAVLKILKLFIVIIHGRRKTYSVVSTEGKTLASCAFLFDDNRAYYWLVGNEPESRDYGASSLLIDAFARDYANRGLVLDFEGSDDKGVADFYKKFGAVAEVFTTIYNNRLPFPFNLLKRVPALYGTRFPDRYKTLAGLQGIFIKIA